MLRAAFRTRREGSLQSLWWLVQRELLSLMQLPQPATPLVWSSHRNPCIVEPHKVPSVALPRESRCRLVCLLPPALLVESCWGSVVHVASPYGQAQHTQSWAFEVPFLKRKNNEDKVTEGCPAALIAQYKEKAMFVCWEGTQRHCNESGVRDMVMFHIFMIRTFIVRVTISGEDTVLGNVHTRANCPFQSCL